MKRLLLLAITLLSLTGMSQAAEPILGVRAGLDINSLSGPGFKNACGYTVGAVYDIPVTIQAIEGFYVEPGLFIYKDRWGVNKKDFSLAGDLGASIDRLKSVYFSTWGLRIPVVMGWGYNVDKDWKILAYTGPEMSIGIKNKFHLNAKVEGADAKLLWDAYGDDGSAHRVDVAWKFGLGAEYQSWHLDISGALGMTHVFKDVIDNSNLSRVAITLGYNFTL